MPRRKSFRWLDKASPLPGPQAPGPSRGRLTGRLLSLLALVAALGCGGASPVAPVAGTQSQIASGAILTAIAAGTLWVAGKGCRLQGCPYGSYCNQKTGYCDVRKCAEGCPEGTICNEGLGRCQAPPPPSPPNDFLPQDDARLPPGTH